MMTTSAAAEKVAGQLVEKKDEKVEKRRALGRGLESLLPGSRAVAPGGAGGPVQGGVGGSEQQVPRLARNDKGDGAGVATLEPSVSGEIAASRTGVSDPHELAAGAAVSTLDLPAVEAYQPG